MRFTCFPRKHFLAYHAQLVLIGMVEVDAVVPEVLDGAADLLEGELFVDGGQTTEEVVRLAVCAGHMEMHPDDGFLLCHAFLILMIRLMS